MRDFQLDDSVSVTLGQTVPLHITVEEDGDGPLHLTVQLSQETPGPVLMRGLFLDLADQTLTDGLDADGDGLCTTRFAAGGVVDLGEGIEMSGAHSLDGTHFDVGLGFDAKRPLDQVGLSLTLSHQDEKLYVEDLLGMEMGLLIYAPRATKQGHLKVTGRIPDISCGDAQPLAKVGLPDMLERLLSTPLPQTRDARWTGADFWSAA